MGKLVLTMIVRNEAGRYLKGMLESHREYIDEAVIIDDGSEDDTADICTETLRGIPLTLIRNAESMFHREFLLRQQQWRETLRTEPDWILSMDADERFEAGAAPHIRQIVDREQAEVVSFRLFDMWSETHYRDDLYWQAHRRYFPFLVRNRPGRSMAWKQTDQHCGRFPLEIYALPALRHPLRVQHFGWAREEDRKQKYERYKRLDPDGKFGWPAQYESILDPHPNLSEWKRHDGL